LGIGGVEIDRAPRRKRRPAQSWMEGRKRSGQIHSGIRTQNDCFWKAIHFGHRRKMRMKFNKSSRLVLIAAVSLLAATLVTACSQIDETLTVDFVFVASSKAAGANNYGLINVFEINSESGKMRQIPSSPFPSGGRDPVSEAVSADNGSLFVANQDDNSIVQFVIGSDGKLYPYFTVNTPGIFPVAIAANKANLFVVDTYQPLPVCSTAEPCSGSIAVFPLAGSSSTCAATVCLGPSATNTAVNSNYWPLQITGSSDIIAPTAVNIVSGSNSGSNVYVYVAAYDSTVSPHLGYIFGFQVGAGGVLTALPGSPFAAGVQPSGVASDSTGSYLYVTDFGGNDVLAYNVAASGALSTMSNSPFLSGNQPTSIVVDPAYPYAYVTNSLDATITAYTMKNGALSSLGTYTTGEQPVAIGIDPSTQRFIFTANYLGDSVSGFQLSPGAGSLVESQYSPFSSNDWPTAVAAIPHNGTGGGIQP
jgi:6-phosphogluconolactonase